MTRTTANGLMLLTALIWGTTFVAQQLGMNHIGPLAYTGARFLLGTLVVLPLAWWEWRRLHAQGVRLDRTDLLAWCGLGVLLCLGAVMQQIGIKSTSVSNAGFLTALYVPMVPMLSWLIDRQRPHFTVWPATIGSFIGTFFLSGGQFDGLNTGDFWVISSTVFWAFHVVWVGRVASRKGASIMLAATQFWVCGLLACALTVWLEPWSSASLQAALPAIAYGGVLSVGIAFTLQVVAQRHTPASDAAIFLSSEILFAAVAGALYLDEHLTPTQWGGGLLIFACILAVQLVPMLQRTASARQ
jgi:drug/metabolite transporter (DMT)-like permease